MNSNENTQSGYGFSDVLFDASKKALAESERFDLNEVPNIFLVKFLLMANESMLRDFLKKMNVDEEELQKALEKQLNPYLVGKEAKSTVTLKDTKRVNISKFNKNTFSMAAENSVGLYNLVDESCFILAMLTETEIKGISPYDKSFVEFLKELNINPEVAECYFEGKLRRLEIMYSEIETSTGLYS